MTEEQAALAVSVLDTMFHDVDVSVVNTHATIYRMAYIA